MSSGFDDAIALAITQAQAGNRKAMIHCLNVLEKPFLKMVKRYAAFTDRFGDHINTEDLFNEAVVVTIEEIGRFKPDNQLPDDSIKNQFVKYYVALASTRLRRKCQEQVRIIDMPDWATKYAKKINQAIRELEANEGHNFSLESPCPEKVAAASGAPLSKVKLYISRGFHLSPSAQFAGYDDQPREAEADGMNDGQKESTLEKKTISDETQSLLADAWSTLSSREKQVLAMRFGFGCEPTTRKAIGESLNLSDFDVRHAEVTGMKAIQEYLS